MLAGRAVLKAKRRKEKNDGSGGSNVRFCDEENLAMLNDNSNNNGDNNANSNDEKASGESFADLTLAIW